MIVISFVESSYPKVTDCRWDIANCRAKRNCVVISLATAVERSSRRCVTICGMAIAVSTPVIAKTTSNSIRENPRLDLKII